MNSFRLLFFHKHPPRIGARDSPTHLSDGRLDHVRWHLPSAVARRRMMLRRRPLLVLPRGRMIARRMIPGRMTPGRMIPVRLLGRMVRLARDLVQRLVVLEVVRLIQG